VNYRGGHVLGGDERRRFVYRWLMEKELVREARRLRSDWYLRWTFVVAVLTCLAAIAAAVMPYLVHPRLGLPCA
jgi:hypothetical protein